MVVFAREHEGQWALVAINNDAVARTVEVTLPSEAATRFTGTRNGRLALEVPALFGVVQFSR